ncbi:MAG: tetratricopeptide repeat protein, partial [Anaerolineales bacterium]
TLLHKLVNAIQERISEYFVILIDDFQFAAGNETILQLVNWFLDHQPDNCCLILASRVMPDLPYLKLTARQEIAGLGSEDLAFTPEEIQSYLANNHNLQLPLEEARKLAAETEGWITGILLGTHTLWKGLIRSISAAKARDEQIFDYMAQEIFDQQPEAIKHFLKSTSILNVLTPSFCDHLLGISDSEATLDYLEQANLFILRLSGDEKAFRYHALFQEFLFKQFAPQELEQRSALQRSAGQLRLAEGNWERALEFFLASGSDDQAIAVIKEHMEAVYRSGRLVTLRRWLDAVDPAKLNGDPALLIMRGRVYRQAGEFEQALGCYEAARQLSAERGDEIGELGLKIHEALVHQYSGAMKDAKEMAEAVLGDAREKDLEPAMRAQAHRILGEYHHLAGELKMAKKEFRQSLKLYQQAGDRYHQSVLLQALGTTARRMGNPLEAEEHYTRAVEILKGLGNRWRMAELQNNIAMGYYYQGDYEKALEIFQQALKDAREAGHQHTEAIVLISLGDLYADLQDVSSAQDHFQAGLDGARATNDVFLEVYCLCALANLYRVDEAWEHAYALLDEASALSGEEGSGYLKGLVALARGMVAHDHGKLGEAHAAFQDAIAKLTNAGAQRELTRAQFWDANTLFRMEFMDEAFSLLESAVKLTREIKHPHLLVVDGVQMIPMLEQADSSTSIPGLDQLLIRIRKHNLATLRSKSRAVSPAAAPPVLEVLALGKDTVKVNGKPIPHTDWKGPLVKELFFYLLENEPVRREIILDEFWPQYSTSKAQSVYHASLYRMRRILPKGLIVYDNKQGAYVIDRNIDTWYDARAFSTLCERARSEADPESTLEEAVRIYHGEFLPSIYSDWCLTRRSTYHNEYMRALSRLAALKSERGKFDDAASLYRRAIEVEPYQEQLHRGLMWALSEGGRKREALQHYSRLQAMLKADMDMPPTSETTALSEQIKEQITGKG